MITVHTKWQLVYYAIYRWSLLFQTVCTWSLLRCWWWQDTSLQRNITATKLTRREITSIRTSAAMVKARSLEHKTVRARLTVSSCSVPNQSSNTVNVECVTASEVFNMCYLVINYHELIYIKEIKWLYLCFIAVINYGYKFGCVWFKSWVCHT